MNYKNYIGQYYTDETGLIRGMVINTNDVITFYGKTMDEAQQAFYDSVDDYLEFCDDINADAAPANESPNNPESINGRNLRSIKPNSSNK